MAKVNAIPSLSRMIRDAKRYNAVVDDVGFFFEYDGQVIQLPVNPEKITVTTKGDNTSKELINVGEISILKKNKLSSISFSSFFPLNEWFPSIRTSGQFRKPQFYKKWFDDKMEESKYVRFIVTGVKPNINMLVSIDSLEIEHRAAEEEDMYYTLTLKEYREYGIKKGVIKTSDTKSNTTIEEVTAKPAIPVTPKEPTIGCTVVVNGRYFASSYGDEPHGDFNNFTGKISHIVAKPASRQKYCYHITTMSGGYRGWVTRSQIEVK